MPSGCSSLGRHCTIHTVVTSKDYLGICLNIDAREEVHKSGGAYEIHTMIWGQAPAKSSEIPQNNVEAWWNHHFFKCFKITIKRNSMTTDVATVRNFILYE